MLGQPHFRNGSNLVSLGRSAGLAYYPRHPTRWLSAACRSAMRARRARAAAVVWPCAGRAGLVGSGPCRARIIRGRICAATGAGAGARRARGRRRCGGRCCRGWRWTIAQPPPASLSGPVRAAGRRGVARDRLRRRRASALAGARQSGRRADRLRAVPGRRRQGPERDRGASSSPTSACTPTTRARCCAGCPRPASGGRSSCSPTRGRRSATTSAGSCRRRRWRELARVHARPAPSCGSPPTSATTPAPMLLAMRRGRAAFAGRPTAPRDWRRRAGRLAADALRGRRPCARGGDAISFGFRSGLNCAQCVNAPCDKLCHFPLANRANSCLVSARS